MEPLEGEDIWVDEREHSQRHLTDSQGHFDFCDDCEETQRANHWSLPVDAPAVGVGPGTRAYDILDGGYEVPTQALAISSQDVPVEIVLPKDYVKTKRRCE